MKKVVAGSEHTRNRIIAGANAAVRLVGDTVGPNDRTVVSSTALGHIEVFSSSRAALRGFSLPGVIENAGSKLMSDLGDQLEEQTGDGSSLGMLIANAILNTGEKYISAGYDPALLRKGLKSLLPYAVGELSREVKRPSEKELRNFAAVAAVDDKVGELVVDALLSVDFDGQIEVKPSNTDRSYYKAQRAFVVSSGFQSEYMATDDISSEAVLDDPAVLVCACPITAIGDILPILNECSLAGKALLIVAEKIDGAVVKSFVSNIAQGTIRLCSVEVPGTGTVRQELLEDLAAYTGTTVFGTPLYPDPRAAGLNNCGTAEKAVISRYKTLIFGGRHREDFPEYIAGLEHSVSRARNIVERERTEKRIAVLRERNAELFVFSGVKSAQRAAVNMVEKAVRATRAAQREGVLPGGATAYLHLASALKEHTQRSPDIEKVSATIMAEAIMTPARRIIENAGYEAEPIIKSLLTKGKNVVFDVRCGEYADHEQAGITDSAAGVIRALERGVELGAQLLSIGGSVLIDAVTKAPGPVPDDLNVTPQDFL